ncbi:MAG: hypothetical protein P8K08_27575 [Fuerstiella sp.]|nr:hypothetical protein [Fuerstiella sp.]
MRTIRMNYRLICGGSVHCILTAHVRQAARLSPRDFKRPLDAPETDDCVLLIKRTLLLACGVLAFVLFAGCGQLQNRSSIIEPQDSETLHTEVERGPIRVTVDVSPKEPRLSDEPTLTLTITAADGVQVNAPPFGESLGEFVIRDFHEPVPKRSDGHRIVQQIYTLEPTRAGLVSVAPITIRFVDNRPDGDGREHTVETEALSLNVATIVPSEAPSLNDLRPPAPPVELDAAGVAPTWLWAVVGVITLLVAYTMVRRRRRGRQTAEPQVSPQELASRELRDLISRKLSETDVKAFFMELTGIVRRYIERSTGVHAPEQTTEEFLREVNTNSLFADEINARLGAFLESADLVKFAGYHPDQEGIKRSTHRAKQFIELKANTAVSPRDDGELHSADPDSPMTAVTSQETVS